MIRLTDKQIPKDTTTPEGLDPKKLKVFKCGYKWGARAGADAQLKRVVKWLKQHTDRRYWGEGHCTFSQSLLDEVKDV